MLDVFHHDAFVCARCGAGMCLRAIVVHSPATCRILEDSPERGRLRG